MSDDPSGRSYLWSLLFVVVVLFIVAEDASLLVSDDNAGKIYRIIYAG
jgi:hypothetical protein